MQNDLLNKSLALGIILMFVGTGSSPLIINNFVIKENFAISNSNNPDIPSGSKKITQDMIETKLNSKKNDINKNRDINDDLLGWWDFNEWFDSTAYDKSGYNNHGIIYGGIEWEDGISGNALDFDGSDDYVEISDTSNFEFINESVTFCAWITIKDNFDRYHNFINLGDSVDNYPVIGLTKGRSSYHDGRIYFEIYQPGIGSSVVFSNLSGDLLPKNQWLFLTGVINNQSEELKLYINGSLQGTTSLINYNLSVAENLDLCIGQSAGNGYINHDKQYGLIDEVRIYNRALNNSEITYLYTHPSGSNKILPTASFNWTPSKPHPDETITFNASSSFDINGTIVLYEWDWNNDGIFEENDTIYYTTHEWDNIGKKRVILKVTDDKENNDTKIIYVPVFVNHPPDIEWSKTYGGSGHEEAWFVEQTSDGGFIFTGCTDSYGSGSSDMWLVKTDENGNENWNKTWGAAAYDQGYSVQQTTDGGYIVCGEYNYQPGVEIFLWKTDNNGNLIWDNNYAPSGKYGKGFSVDQTNDNGYIVTGYCIISGFYRLVLLKVSSDGLSQWYNFFGAAQENQEGYDVKQTSDGGYIITGYTESYGGQSGKNLWLIKTDNTGDEQWNRTFTYGESGTEIGYSVEQTYDGGYIVTGWCEGAPYGQVWVIKTDQYGYVEWNNFFGQVDKHQIGHKVHQTLDSGFIVSGYNWGGSEEAFAIRLDNSGYELWNMSFGDPAGGSEKGLGCGLTADGGCIICGYTTFLQTSCNAWLIKLGPDFDINFPPSAHFYWTPQYPLPNQTISFDASSSYDLNGYIILYEWDWNNDGVYDENHTTPFATHSWSNSGDYPIALRVTDNSSLTNVLVRTIHVRDNQPPATPITPSGPTSLAIGQSGTYSTITTDPDSDFVQYRFDWDADGFHEYSDWTNLVPSGQSVSLSHIWYYNGTFVVKSQARDEHGYESSWSYGLPVIINTGNIPPVADFIWTPPSPNPDQTVNFDASGSYDPGSDREIIFYEWDMDNDGLYDDRTGKYTTWVWPSAGAYPVSLKVTDNLGAIGNIYKTVYIGSVNRPPNIPSIPIGSNILNIEQFEAYTTSTTDPDNDLIRYRFDWNAAGSHDYSDWTPLVASGTPMSISHFWDSAKIYAVKAQAVDEHGASSDWSDPIIIICGSLKAYFSFDNPNNIGQDDSWNNCDFDKHGNLKSIPGIVNNGISSFSIDDYLYGVIPLIDGGYTISAWVKPRNIYSAEHECILGGAGGPNQENPMILGIRSDVIEDKIKNKWVSMDTLNYFEPYSEINYPLDSSTWQFISITREYLPTLDQYDHRLYINGILQSSIINNNRLFFSIQKIGRFWDQGGGSDPTFEGCLDELAVFNRPLKNDEIMVLYGYPNGNPPPTAYLYNMVPAAVQQSDRVYFTIGGDDSNGYISEYQLDIDGDGIYENTWQTPGTHSVSISNYSPGNYYPAFRVVDNKGRYSAPEYEKLVIKKIGSITFFPWYYNHANRSATAGWAEASASSNSKTGAISSYAKAIIGIAEAQGYVNTLSWRANKKSDIMVECQFDSVGGKEGTAVNRLLVSLYKEDLNDPEFYKLVDYEVYDIDPVLDWNLLGNILFAIMSAIFPVYLPLPALISAWSSIATRLDIVNCLRSTDYLTKVTNSRFNVDPNCRYIISCTVDSRASGVILFQGMAARAGQVRYITSEYVNSMRPFMNGEIGNENKGLKIAAFGPVNITICDPYGRIVNHSIIEIENATIEDIDLNHDGIEDMFIHLPEPLEGNYSIFVNAKNESQQNDTFSILANYDVYHHYCVMNETIENISSEPYTFNTTPARIPSTPTGPNTSPINHDNLFQTNSIQPENSQVYYMWDWGDGNYSTWLGPYESDESVQSSYTWHQPGIFNIRIKAKNSINEIESDWSESHQIEVIMPNAFLFGIVKNIQETDNYTYFNASAVLLLSASSPFLAFYQSNELMAIKNGALNGRLLQNVTFFGKSFNFVIGRFNTAVLLESGTSKVHSFRDRLKQLIASNP